MRYFIHVIDKASVFESEKSPQKRKLSYCISQDEKECHILQSDAFYSIKSEDTVDATTSVLNIIRIMNEEGDLIPLSDAVVKTKKKEQIMDFSSEIELEDFPIKTVTKPYGECFSVEAEIDFTNPTHSWTEVHNIEIFLVSEDQIIRIEPS